MEKKQNTKNKNQPDIKNKAGIFQLAGWKKKIVIPAKHDCDIEREIEQINICLSVGVRKNGEWKNVPVWFRLSQFENLKEIVDDFAEGIKQLNENEIGGAD